MKSTIKDKKKKTILIRLDEETHNKIRHISIDTGISINAYVNSAIISIIASQEKENKK